MTAHSTSGRFRHSTIPPVPTTIADDPSIAKRLDAPIDLGVSMEDLHDLERHETGLDNAEDALEPPAVNDNVVNISYMLTPGAGARERAQVLATLEPHEFDQLAKAQAKEIGCKVSTLARYVEEERRKLTQKKATNQDIEWHVDPASEPVEGAEMFNAVEAILSRHVILPKGAAPAIAIWIGHTWAIDAARHTPILALLSPQPECGKSTALELILSFCRQPEAADNITPAGIYYAVEKLKPTLAIDEMDSMPDGGEACRNILNSGHRRGGYVRRVEEVGGERQLVKFNTFCAKIVAAIGRLKPTLMSRSIIIWLRRKRADEIVASIEESEAERSALLSCLCRWAEDNVGTIKNAKPALPPALANRSADNWRELFKIASVVGRGWPEKLALASLALSGRKDDTATEAVLLLQDIKSLFEARREEVLASETIINHLVALEARPWPEFRHGKPITARQLASMLDDFEIVPKQHWQESRNVRGYHINQFLDVFERYIPSLSARTLETASNQAFSHIEQPLEPTPSSTSPMCEKSHEISVSNTLADKTPPGGRDYTTDPLTDDEFPDIPAFLDRRRP